MYISVNNYRSGFNTVSGGSKSGPLMEVTEKILKSFAEASGFHILSFKVLSQTFETDDLI